MNICNIYCDDTLYLKKYESEGHTWQKLPVSCSFYLQQQWSVPLKVSAQM